MVRNAIHPRAYFYEEKGRKGRNMDIFRNKLGICPQHDILFSDLNIREHLEMFSIFKGVDSNNINSEINKILKDFNLEDIQYIIAKNLSAGQRRKLSIAMAIVGGSEIIFLNEWNGYNFKKRIMGNIKISM